MSGESLACDVDNHFSNDKMIRQSDIAMISTVDLDYFGIWINGTQPTHLCHPPLNKMQVPDNTFPFTRLATTASTDGSSSFLYHQMNGTMLAEEQFDIALDTWTDPEYIHISED